MIEGRFLFLNHESNALDYLKKAVDFISLTESDPIAWKWVAMGLHGALYGFAILACKGTTSYNVIENSKTWDGTDPNNFLKTRHKLRPHCAGTKIISRASIILNMSNANCLFCKVINGELPSKPVYSTEDVVAVRDINPMAPTHILILPKKHISALAQAQPEDQEVLGKIQLAAKAIAAAEKLEGFRLVLNNGKIAGQTVDHVHYHLLGGRRMSWPPG